MQLSAQCETNGNNLKQIANWTPPVVSTFWARASVPRPLLHLCHETLASEGEARRGVCPELSGTQLCTYCTIRAGKGVGQRESGKVGGLELLLLVTVTRPKYSRTIFNVAGKYWEYLPQMLHDI